MSDFPILLTASPATTVLAVACVVAGGPWFAGGLRALRARRALRSLAPEAGSRLCPGPLHVRGRVALESPMFAPLSGRPCARWELQVRDERGLFVARITEAREFRLELEDGSAQVPADCEGHLAVTAERTYATPGELSENLASLFARAPELRWLRARGGSIRIVERALFAGAQASVLGSGLQGAQLAHEAGELLRTGTDDVAWQASPQEPPVEWRIGPCADLDRCIVSDRDLDPHRLAPAPWRATGAIMGPALTLAGLLELAEAAGRGLSGGM